MITFIAGMGFGYLLAAAAASLVEDRAAFRWAGGVLLVVAVFLWITARWVAWMALR